MADLADGLAWEGARLARTEANVARLRELVAATDIGRTFRSLALDERAVGSRAPYLSALTAGGTPVIVKLNLSESEVAWATAVGKGSVRLGPEVLASGVLSGTSVCWLAQERVDHGIAHDRAGNGVMMKAAARFHLWARTADTPPAAPGPAHPQSPEDVKASLAAALLAEPPPIYAELAAEVDVAWRRLVAITGIDWCHGDLHPGNVVRRGPRSSGLLIGFHPRRSPWPFDAAWLAGQALRIDVQPLYTWIYELLRQERESVLGERIDDADFRFVTYTTGAWSAVSSWSRLDAEQRVNPRLLRVLDDLGRTALAT